MFWVGAHELKHLGTNPGGAGTLVTELDFTLLYRRSNIAKSCGWRMDFNY